jgi:hypothetical protein
VNARCSIVRLELDVSLPTSDFLQFAHSTFLHGVNLIQSEKYQPMRFRMETIRRSRWPAVMADNQIHLLLHRPALGEPALITSSESNVLQSIITRFERKKG